MSTERSELLIVANSGRAIAEAAVRAGYWVRLIDAFADEDSRACAECIQVPMKGHGLDADAVRCELERILSHASGRPDLVYGAGLEPSADLLEWLESRVTLLGNDSTVLRLLADPNAWFARLDRLGIHYPEVRFDPPEQDAGWLLKEPASSGGLGVRRWRSDLSRPEGAHYFQRLLDGVPMSLLFIADGKRSIPIGYSRLANAADAMDGPFFYAGARSLDAAEVARCRAIETYARALVADLGLRGINGLDFILHRGRVQLLELNPRPTATLALHPSPLAEGWIACHVRACQGLLPDLAPHAPSHASAHRILYAERDLSVPAGLSWPDWVRDRPWPGTWIPRGAPLCSLYAEATDVDVEMLLAERARLVLSILAGRSTLLMSTEVIS
ncbi:ATP-grasp fold domain protein, DUF201-type [Thiorhodococcus drewsii AZ1]|uniref:ATP-grasp fold domain protein, DUF201-type n=1 Tax=Thiorhodococcus drewsii AZ1 TaxID=765913 RepID=G2DX03_9GAMM|nr:ATP-grasp domain-containing protein [Thiorhodococcus drewsii]EGV33357.1 ATP-grasp fold domain protein, DUF201-type [Thiorhodococcus drewsii AZ1]